MKEVLLYKGVAVVFAFLFAISTFLHWNVLWSYSFLGAYVFLYQESYNSVLKQENKRLVCMMTNLLSGPREDDNDNQTR